MYNDGFITYDWYSTYLICMAPASIFKPVSNILGFSGAHFDFLRPRPTAADANLDIYQILIYI